MSNRVWRIIEAVIWLIVSTTQVAVHTAYMVEHGIDWHMAFVIIFSVLFGCWLMLLLNYIFDNEK